MKKSILISALLFFFSFIAFAQVEDIAKEVLKAYKTKDVELLKKNASGMLKMAISDSYFEDKGLQEDIKAAENWDGKFREIRYNSGDMMGKKLYLASVYFSDIKDNPDEIYTVALSSMDKENWVMFGSGIVAETKEEFNKMRLTLLPVEDKVATKKVKSFSLEMYDGPGYKKATQKQVEESFALLNADNFFISLANGDDWIQVAFSDKGYSIDYNDAKGHFMIDDFLKKEEALQLLINYFNQEDGWKDKYTWVDFSY
jgi:hypothetical protein